MNAVTHLEKVITGEVSAVTHLEKVIAGETSAVTYTEKVITGEAPPITHLQKVIAGVESPVTHLEYVWAGRTPEPTEHEYTGAVPVTFTADGTPLLGFLISGNMSQTGTPTPDNPIMPQGTGERTGNLFASVWERGSINGTTGQNEVAGTLVRTKDYIPIKPNTAYSFKRDIANGYMNVRLYRADKSYIGAGTTSTIRLISGTSSGNPMGNNTSFCCFEVIDSEAAYIRFNDSSNNTAAKWLMVEGEYTQQTMPDYEPYGYKIPISSANTTTPVYLGEVETTRKIKKLVLTGTETVAGSAVTGGWIITNLSDSINNTTGIQTSYCSHYLSKNNGAMSSLSQGEMCISTQVNNRINFVTTFATAEDFKTYLSAQYAAGTPVCVWYVLAEPETGIVNEPLRKIGDYADTLSMEQAGVSIPTNNGSTTVDVETTLKPSEVYIKYKGV